jgi:transglutaminase-like putative cysteine protease
MKREPTLLRCVMLVFVVDVALRIAGFDRVYRAIRRISATGTDVRDVDVALNQVLRATALYPGRSRCLEQSIAIATLLRRRGVDARVRLAVQHYPFAAHAWVEIEGRPVTESVEVAQRFACLPEVAA